MKISVLTRLPKSSRFLFAYSSAIVPRVGDVLMIAQDNTTAHVQEVEHVIKEAYDYDFDPSGTKYCCEDVNVYVD